MTSVVLVLTLLLLTSLAPLADEASGHSATGGVLNVAPNFTQEGTVGLTVYPASVDNSGTDTIEFDATFYDGNGDNAVEIAHDLCTLKVYEGSDSSGILVRTWTGAWDREPTGDEFIIDPTGTTHDGLAFISNVPGTTSPGFVWTVPTTLSGSTDGVVHYAELHIEDDDGENASTGTTFLVTDAIQILGIFKDNGVAVDLSAPYSWPLAAFGPGTPGVTSGDGINEQWLVVRNAGSDPTDSFTVTFIDNAFTSQSRLVEIPIDGSIDFEFYESVQAPGGTDDPAEHGQGTTVVDDSDGIWNHADFTGVNNYMWIRFEVDIPAENGYVTDYMVDFAVAAD